MLVALTGGPVKAFGLELPSTEAAWGRVLLGIGGASLDLTAVLAWLQTSTGRKAERRKYPRATWPILKTGSRGEPVRTAQYLLRAHQHSVDTDGIFGRETANAVRSFQEAHRLEPDGVVGRNTWPALLIPIRRGASGYPVRAAQRLLSANPVDDPALNELTVDGAFGFATETAVRATQKAARLPADGIVGFDTWRWLITQVS